MKNYSIKSICLLYISVCIGLNSVHAQDNFPGEKWKKYVKVSDAGFSESRISRIKQEFENGDGAALLVIVNGRVLISWGDNIRKFMIHSVRKGFMNAMIGREIANSTIRLNQTLEELGIDEIHSLSKEEKTATVEDLLSARSGIYLPSTYSTKGMEERLPERGSHKPGSFWYYNNWDFNSLLTIYEQQSGKKFFEAFQNELAIPIGMEDFQLTDTYYRIEPEVSLHPAYLFRMSARDMARFGWLYLEKGNWNGLQLVPREWVEKSTATVTENLGSFENKGNYGWLWWIADWTNGRPMFYASGAGGHRIFVLPEDNMVIVHRSDTYIEKNVGDQAINNLVTEILAARKGPANSEAVFEVFDPPLTSLKNTFEGSMDTFLGTYNHRFLGNMTIRKDSNRYFLETGVGVFQLYVQDDKKFYPEDLQIPIIMKKATTEEKKYTIEAIFNEDRIIEEVEFYY